MADAPSMHTPTQNDQFRFPDVYSFKDLNSSAAVILFGNKCAHNVFSNTSSLKIYCTKTSIVALLSTLVDLSTWIVYHSNSLIFSNNYASISSAISLIHLVLAKRGTHATFELQSLLKVHNNCPSQQAGSTLPIVKGFSALAMQLATKNDALSADTFDEVVAFNICFCSHVHNFSF